MTRFRWMLALLVTVTLSAGTAWPQQVSLTTLALASPLGQETPVAQPDLPSSEDTDDEAGAACCALHRFLQELLDKWTLLWDCGQFQQAEEFAAAAVRLCPGSVDAQHALVVAQIVNSGGVPCGVPTGCPSGCCPLQNVLRVLYQQSPGCAAGCTYEVAGPTYEVPATATCCSQAAPAACAPCAETCTRAEACRACVRSACETKCACAKATCACGKDCCCAKPSACGCATKRARAKSSCTCCDECACTSCGSGGRSQKVILHLHSFVSGLTPAGAFGPDLSLPMVGRPPMPPMAFEFRHMPLPPPAMLIHGFPYPMMVDADCYTAQPCPPVCVPPPPVCAAPPMWDVIRTMPGHPMQAHPPLCPVMHCEMVAAQDAHHQPLQIAAEGAGIRVQTDFFVARCDRVNVEHDDCILEGNVQIQIHGLETETRGRMQAARISAQRIHVNLKDHTFKVDSGSGAPTPRRVYTEPVSRTTYPGTMPAALPQDAPMPRRQSIPRF